MTRFGLSPPSALPERTQALQSIPRGLTTLFLCVAAWSACSDEAPEPCEGVLCSGDGVCVAQSGAPSCACDEGFVAAGLLCISDDETLRILETLVEPTSITQGGAATITVTISGLAGGPAPELTTAEGATVAPFVPGTLPRTWEISVSWAELHERTPIQFVGSAERMFVVRAENEAGDVEETSVAIQLTCSGGACDGRCREAITLEDDSVSPDVVECGGWTCGDAFPLSCMGNPTAYLWMTPSQTAHLLEDVYADVEADGVFMLHGRCLDVGVEIHGGLSVEFQKKSFRLKFNREDGWYPLDPFAETPVPDPVGFKQLVLKAHWVDPSLFRDRLTEEVLTAAGGLAPRATFVNLVLNGRYHGVYAAFEAVHEDYFLRHGMSGDGDLYKAVSHYANFQWKEDPLAGLEKKLNKEGSDDRFIALMEAIDTSSATAQAIDDNLAPLIDLDLYLKYVLANVVAANKDTFTKNYYLYGEPGTPFLTVNWDADATWGRTWNGEVEHHANLGALGKSNGLSAKLFDTPQYRDLYFGYMAQILDTAADLPGRVASLRLEVEQDIPFEECRWDDKDATYDEDRPVMDAFIEDRLEFLQQELTSRSRE